MKCNHLIGVSVLPALFIMPALADTITVRQVISENTTYTDLSASNIASTTANNGGVFYLQDVPNVVLDFDGVTVFSGNSLNNGGMGGVIGNGWLASTSGTGYTVGGKIVFNDAVTFADNSTNNSNGGGAIFNYGNGTATSPDIIFYGDAVFSGNQVTTTSPSVYAGGGAINHNDGMIVFNGDATFGANTSASQGGAIMSAGDMIFNGVSDFAGNSATLNGGAIAMMGGDITFEGVATFSENTAGGASAIYLSEGAATMAFRDTAKFSANTGVGTLLNNSTTASVLFGGGATFDGNTNNLNGALVNRGTVDVSSGDFIFTNNTGSNGGGVKNSGTINVQTNGVVRFDKNSTASSAGAYDNGGTSTLAASTVSFTNNTASAGYGGAIFNAGDLSILGVSNVFSGNTVSDTGATKSGGGAIHNRGNTGTTTLIIGTDTSTNTFYSNSSSAHGGAVVSRAFDGTEQNAVATFNGKTTFSGNSASLNGGAIWNAVAESDGATGSSIITFNGDTAFTNNTAGGQGGALYNNDTVVFNGGATFSGNTANGVANDVYNDGTVTFNGATSLDGGIDGTGILNISDGATLDIGTATVNQSAINLNGTMLATLRADSTPQITVTGADGFTGSGAIKLALERAGTYHVFGDQIFNNIDISSSVYDLSWNGGDVTAILKSASDIATQNNISNDSARMVSGLSESSATQLNNISVQMQQQLAAGTDAGRVAVEHAARAIAPETKSVGQSVGASLHSTLISMASGRLSDLSLGRSGGDDFYAVPSSVWAQGVYNKSKQNDAFNGYTRGVAIGIDGAINDIWTMGVGYMFTHSDIGASARNTEVDSSSVFAYAKYQPSNWYMDAVINYTMSDYSERGYALGAYIGSDYDIDSFGAYLSTGYNFLGGITPELSLRYMHLGSADYTSSLGINNHIDAADFLTASLGTKYEMDIVTRNGILFSPMMHYAINYDIVSDDNVVTIAIPGVNTYMLNGQRLSRIGATVGIGLGMTYAGLDITLSYDLETRDEYTSQTGRVKFKYTF